MKTIDRPLMRYPGSKFRLREWIYGFFPPHVIYVEPFCGSAALLFFKKRAVTEVINDTNKELVEVFRVLRNPDKASALQERIRLTPYARDEYELCWEEADDEIERARRYLLRVSMGQRGKLTKSGFDTRINKDGYAGRLAFVNTMHQRVALFCDRLENTIIENRDALEVIDQYDRKDTLHFVDPEYLDVVKGYPDKFTKDDHKRLSEILIQAKGMVVLCGYASEQYQEWYEANGWHRVSTTTYADGGFKRKECLWLNPSCFQYQRQKNLFDREL